MWVTSCQISRLREGLAGGVAGWGLAQAALSFGFEARLVQRFLLRRPVAIHLPIIHVIVTAVGMVSLWKAVVNRENPYGQRIKTIDGKEIKKDLAAEDNEVI